MRQFEFFFNVYKILRVATKAMTTTTTRMGNQSNIELQ